MTRNPWLFRLIWLIAIVPLLIAWGLAMTADKLALETKNHGQLMPAGIVVPKTLSAPLNGKWGLLMLSEDCRNSCEQQLYRLQQLHTAMGSDLKRLQPVWLTTGLSAKRPAAVDFRQVQQLSNPGLVSWFNQQGLSWQDYSLWLVDPLGNLVMRFPPSLSAQAILADIDWLLKASHIG